MSVPTVPDLLLRTDTLLECEGTGRSRDRGRSGTRLA